ncbi:MAG: 2-amino-4-hydroxy-6-hydroxymethyldihydropteridine diphosphokinase [Bacteriovoracaceae bacterium]|nr:2-amino-4-hydroxy-6-hydroxymethyldihydropteridine diphosphokinase [Bacteriovoracaceae bacterium]
MYLVVGTGSNLKDRLANLNEARERLKEYFELVAESRIYCSKAEDYLDQPFFYNQVLEFKLPVMSPQDVMHILLDIEDEMGRLREISKGPRIIDLDILFMGENRIKQKIVEIPHPRLFDRSFVVTPLKDLPCFSELSSRYSFRESFENPATPVVC